MSLVTIIVIVISDGILDLAVLTPSETVAAGKIKSVSFQNTDALSPSPGAATSLPPAARSCKINVYPERPPFIIHNSSFFLSPNSHFPRNIFASSPPSIIVKPFRIAAVDHLTVPNPSAPQTRPTPTDATSRPAILRGPDQSRPSAQKKPSPPSSPPPRNVRRNIPP